MAEDPSEQATGNKTATTPSAPLLPQRGSTAVSDRPGARPGGPGPTHSDGDAKARMLMTAQLVYFLTPLRVRGPALTPVPACIPSWRPHTQQTAYPLSNGRPGSESQPRRAYQKRAFRGHRRVPNATPYPTPLQDTEMVSQTPLCGHPPPSKACLKRLNPWNLLRPETEALDWLYFERLHLPSLPVGTVSSCRNDDAPTWKTG